MTTIPAEPGFVVVVPLFDNDGIAGLAEHPVAAWRIEADSGQRVPMIDHGEVEEEIDVEERLRRAVTRSSIRTAVAISPMASAATTRMLWSKASRSGSRANPALG